MTRTERCESCAWWRRVAGFNYVDFGGADPHNRVGRRQRTSAPAGVNRSAVNRETGGRKGRPVLPSF